MFSGAFHNGTHEFDTTGKKKRKLSGNKKIKII